MFFRTPNTNVLPAFMKAAICRAPNEITIEEVPVPTPGPRHLLVRVLHASLCHSDLSVLSGAFGTSLFPLIPGHEAIGEVVSLGASASSYGFEIGDVIGSTLWHDMCLKCTYCKIGPEFCEFKHLKGISTDGYFAEYALVDAVGACLVDRKKLEGGGKIAGKRALASVAPLFCSGATVWDALERTKIRPGENVAVVGVGGLGQIAVLYAASFGARVIGLDVRDEQLQACKRLNSSVDTIDMSKISGDVLRKIVKEKTDGRNLDVILVTSGALPAFTNSFSLLGPLSRLAIVGLPAEPIPVPCAVVVEPCASIIGTKACGTAAMQRCLDYSIRMGIFPPVHPRKFVLEDLNEMIALMKAGKVEDGRMVISFDVDYQL